MLVEAVRLVIGRSAIEEISECGYTKLKDPKSLP